MAAAGDEMSGYYLSKTPLKNKGTAFSHEERQTLGLRGLFPAGTPQTLELKLEIAMTSFRNKVTNDFTICYTHLSSLHCATVLYSALLHSTSLY